MSVVCEYYKKMKHAENDIADETLQSILNSIPFPSLLMNLVQISRQHFGWYTKHVPRVYEYPWIIEHIQTIKDKTFLDIGAGVSPLPIFLAECGARIITVDNSANIRNLEKDPLEWDEWGFFDYSILNKNIKSFNMQILEAQFEDKFFDCIYSVSVIEHMTKSTRKLLWKKISRWIKDDGWLLLTVDLIPQTENLWNYCAGQIVEDVEQHGSLSDLKTEMANEGFILKECTFQTQIPGSRVDLCLLSLVKK